MPNRPRVHIIDDDAAVRDSLAFLLGTAEFPVSTYESAQAFLQAEPLRLSGCIITDIRMPEMDGLALLRHLKTLAVPLPVIVITGHGDVPLAVQAMKMGAADFLEKPFDDETLLASVTDAFDRQARHSARDVERRQTLERIDALSMRERQVLDALVVGHPNKIIAYDLGISPRTVEIYRANVMTKMKANSLSDLVRMALLAGVTGNDDNAA